jgi:hypothetical protein
MGKEIGSSGREDVGPARIGLKFTVLEAGRINSILNRPFADSLSNSDRQPKKDDWPNWIFSGFNNTFFLTSLVLIPLHYHVFILLGDCMSKNGYRGF